MLRIWFADAVRGDHDRLDCHQRTGVAGGAVAGPQVSAVITTGR